MSDINDLSFNELKSILNNRLNIFSGKIIKSNLHDEVVRSMGEEMSRLKLIEEEVIKQKSLHQLTDPMLTLKVKNLTEKHGEEKIKDWIYCKALTEWFRESYFNLVNVVKCRDCQKDLLKYQSNAIPTYAERIQGSSSIDIYKCSGCGTNLKIPRYSEVAVILEKKEGLFQEFITAFIALARCQSYPVRLVKSFPSKKVWCELYIYKLSRWLSLDPITGQFDSLKSLDSGLIVGYSHGYGVKDITIRYIEDVVGLSKLRGEQLGIDMLELEREMKKFEGKAKDMNKLDLMELKEFFSLLNNSTSNKVDNGTQSKAHDKYSSNEPSNNSPEKRYKFKVPSIKAIKAILFGSGMDSARAILIIGGIRAIINVLLKSLSIYRKRKPTKYNFQELLFGKEVRGSSMFLGGFVFTWKFLSQLLPLIVGQRDRVTDFISGFVAGLFILFERKDRRISFSQQLVVRAAQSLHDSLHAKNLIRIPHGDSALFAFSTAQILYSYILQHTTLDRSIYRFMISHAQVPHKTLQFNRAVVRQNPLDVQALTEHIQTLNVTPKNLLILEGLNEFPLALPCVALHPDIDSCNRTAGQRFLKVMRMISPIYAGLTFVPSILMRFPNFKKSPSRVLFKCLTGTIRSSAFLATLVTIYQYLICHIRSAQSTFLLKDNKFNYYLCGLIAAFTSIYVEKPSRRTELALYTAPKAIESFYTILYNKSWMFCIPGFEVALFCLGAGTIMMYFQKEPEVISPLLRTVLKRLVGKPITKSAPTTDELTSTSSKSESR